MKRLLLFLGIIISSLTLTACDFSPDDILDQIDQATEEICLEDPDNPVCDIENLDDIEESVVRGLVIDAVALLNNPSNDACDTVFSVTNPDLIDRCKAGKLVTEDITGFTIDSYEQDGDSYIFKGMNDLGEPIEISVTVGSLEDLMKLTSFSAKPMDVCSDDCDDDDPEVTPFETVSQDEARTYIEAFFAAYMDPSISNPMFSENYLEGDMEDEIFKERDLIISNELSVRILSIIFNDSNEFVVEYEYQDGDDLYLRKRPGRIRKRPDLLTSTWDEAIDSSIELNRDVASEFFNQFISDYLNPVISNSDLTSLYFESEEASFISDSRQEALRNGLDISISNLTPYTEFGVFHFIVTLTQDDLTTQSLTTVSIGGLDKASPYLHPVLDDWIDDDCDGDGVCDGDELDLVKDPNTGIDLLSSFLKMYNDPNTQLEELESYAGSNFMFLLFRNYDIENTLEWTLTDDVRVLDDGTFLVTLQATHGDTIIHRDLATRIYANGDNPLFNSANQEASNPLFND